MYSMFKLLKILPTVKNYIKHAFFSIYIYLYIFFIDIIFFTFYTNHTEST